MRGCMRRGLRRSMLSVRGVREREERGVRREGEGRIYDL